jgi:uncharacterized surface protein with fasciclin (FAS1) repeats
MTGPRRPDFLLKEHSMQKLTLIALMLVAAFALAGCSESDNPAAPDSGAADKVKPSERTTLVDVALAVNADTGEFSTLIAALQAAGLVDALAGNGQLTVFAPTDAAFADAGFNPDNIGEVDPAVLTDILLYHVAKGRRLAEDVVSSTQIRMLNRDFTAISLMDGNAYIDEAMIIDTDIPADNGVIHVVDGVLMPSADPGSGDMRQQS